MLNPIRRPKGSPRGRTRPACGVLRFRRRKQACVGRIRRRGAAASGRQAALDTRVASRCAWCCASPYPPQRRCQPDRRSTSSRWWRDAPPARASGRSPARFASPPPASRIARNTRGRGALERSAPPDARKAARRVSAKGRRFLNPGRNCAAARSSQLWARWPPLGRRPLLARAKLGYGVSCGTGIARSRAARKESPQRWRLV
jgi:hypothetical protein